MYDIAYLLSLCNAAFRVFLILETKIPSSRHGLLAAACCVRLQRICCDSLYVFTNISSIEICLENYT